MPANNVTVELVTGSRLHLAVSEQDFNDWLVAALSGSVLAPRAQRFERMKGTGISFPYVTVVASSVAAVYPTTHEPDNPIQSVSIHHPGEAAAKAFRAIRHVQDPPRTPDGDVIPPDALPGALVAWGAASKVEVLPGTVPQSSAPRKPHLPVDEMELEPTDECTCLDSFVDPSDDDPFCRVHGHADPNDLSTRIVTPAGVTLWKNGKQIG